MSDAMTCYEQDEKRCEDPMCLRVGCRLRNNRIASTISPQAIEAGARAMEAKRAELQHAPLARIYAELAQACLTAALAADGMALVTQTALNWLNGEGPDADGKWFGECEDEVVKTPRKYTPRYWWRSKFRAMLSATPPATPDGKNE